MSYKNILTQSGDFICESLENNKEVKVVHGKDNEFKEVNEFIGYVNDIIQGDDGKMSDLALQFADGKIATTSVFTNNKIEKGKIVSVVGYFQETPYGLQFKARGGINPVLKNSRDVNPFSLDLCHRMGIVTGLSEVKMPKVYSADNELVRIGNTDFYYILNDIEIPEEEKIELAENEIDTRHSNYINTEACKSDTVEVEDFVDVDDETAE